MMKRFYSDIKDIIVYEDEHALVVNKPSGLLTIKDEKGSENLYHDLYDYVARQRGKKLFVVHRLDKDTSGLLIFAKDVRTKTVLQDCFEAQAVERKYEAVTKSGTLRPGDSEKIVIFLDEDKNHIVHVSPNGKRCETDVRCLFSKNGKSYLDISLVTGRRNQIRISLSEIGMPIVGDSKYGGIKNARMKLNAYSLTFPSSIGLKKNTFSIEKIFDTEFVKKEREEDDTDRLLSLV